jgi:ATP-dependent helicase/nuclease subunit A
MTEDIEERLAIDLDPDFSFTDDQATVMKAYHEGTGRVCVGSGAGTGKTTTLTRVVAEAVVRMSQPDPEDIDSNPFDGILVTTFTRDAAGQLKTKLKQLLRDHETYADTEFDLALWRWIETDSNISTIDSFTGDLLREIATEVSVAPGFEVRDEIETQELLQKVIRDLESDETYAEALALLEEELEDTTPRRYLFEIHQKLREFCHEFASPDAEQGTTIFTDQLVKDLFQDREPPFGSPDIREIVSSVTGKPQRDVTVPDDDDTIGRMENDYRYSVAFASAVDDLIDAFDAVYDKRTCVSGKLSYQDITYLVWEYLNSEEGSELSESLGRRYSHVFVDEFQDTSYAQCQILKHLINNEEPRTNVLVIGDLKQSIYGWRSADPEIFAHILDHAEEAPDHEPDEYLEATEWTKTDLVTNFRSHPHLVRAGNQLFDYVFGDDGLGAIGTFNIDFFPVKPNRPPTDPGQSRLHFLPLGDVNAKNWRSKEPMETAAVIHGMVQDETVTVGDDEDERPVEAGDVTILFRRGKHIPEFRDALNEHGLDNAVVADRGLFKSEEVGFVVDVLDWFANPHSKDSLLRILRSPVTALADRTLRFLTSEDLNLPRVLDGWPDEDLPESDKIRLEGLVDLRSDLRWDREGPKAELVQKIIQHTGIETIVLAGDDAIQRYGNLWMLVEVVKDWEEEELLAYREFVGRLKDYQTLAQSGDETFEVAHVVDETANETVKLRTAHSSKGLEFPVVVLPDLLATPGGQVESRSSITYRDETTGERQYALRPRPAGDPVDYSVGPGGKWIRGSDYASTLWVSSNRDSVGRFQYDHPYNAGAKDEYAEFWRLLYVAFTRAGDHLLLPLGDGLHYSHQWSTWAHPLIETFRDGGSWKTQEDRQSIDFDLSPGVLHEGDTGDTTIPLDIGLLDKVDPREPAPHGMPDSAPISDDTVEVEQNHVPFAPRQLTPSTLFDLTVCPKRYQYRALEEVSEARGESPPNTEAPDGYSPSHWGTLVHQAMEALHEDFQMNNIGSENGVLAEFLNSHSDISEDLSTPIQNYRNSDLCDAVRSASSVLPEYELSAIHPMEPQVRISGVVDLLFESDQGWNIVDFKTGRSPESGTYLAQQYRTQLATYTWLLHAEYGIEIQNSAIFYTQSGKTNKYEMSPEEFSSDLRELPDQLSIETELGLTAYPDPDPETVSIEDLENKLETRCGSCPFTSICPAWNDRGT